MTIWKSDISDKIKRDFFQSTRYVCTTVWSYNLDAKEAPGEKVRWELYKNAAHFFEQILEVALYKTAAIWPSTSHLTSYPVKIDKTY